MQAIAKFHKVSFAQFLQDSKAAGFIDDETDPEIVKLIWESIQLPKRATVGSAGYDFYLPWPFSLEANKQVVIPTGIRVEIRDGWALLCMPRSGLSNKFGMRLLNTIGLIDSDYFYADNEGHIQVKITTSSNMCLNAGDRYLQGIFLQYGVTVDDQTEGIRKGGFGSTGGVS